jgi:hypothetical protein
MKNEEFKRVTAEGGRRRSLDRPRGRGEGREASEERKREEDNTDGDGSVGRIDWNCQWAAMDGKAEAANLDQPKACALVAPIIPI